MVFLQGRIQIPSPSGAPLFPKEGDPTPRNSWNKKEDRPESLFCFPPHDYDLKLFQTLKQPPLDELFPWSKNLGKVMTSPPVIF